MFRDPAYRGGSGRPIVEALSDSPSVERGEVIIDRDSVETGVGDGVEPEDIIKGLEPRVTGSTIESYNGFRLTRPSDAVGVVESRLCEYFVRNPVDTSLSIC